nr:transcription factor E4F1-like isoform X1 [Rhipicephalus microplus]
MEDLAPQLGGILVGGTSTDEPNSQSSLYSASIGVPVTLVVSGGLPDQSDMEVHSNAMLSTLALQSDDGCGPATQLFLEHLADGQARLKTADGHTLEVDIDPRTIGLVHGNSGVPVLLQVSPDGMLLQRDDVQIALAASGAAAENSTDTTEEQREDAGSSTPCEDSEPMFQDAEHLPLRMYFEVAKETADENSASMEDVQTNTGTAVAIVTPDGDESDADELPAPTGRRVERVERLEDFMDVVTTYHCRFCSFSCAWRSGLMSHIRSCHVAPSSSGSLEPVERPVSSKSTVKQASKPTRAGNNPVAFALTTAGPVLNAEVAGTATCARDEPSIEVDSGAVEPAVSAQVEPPQPVPSTPGKTQVSEITSELATDPMPSRTPMDASLVLESALASMVSAGSNEMLASGSSLLPRGEDGQPVPAQERHIFICGQCSHGFGSLDECKQHMVEVHDLKVATECDVESKKTAVGRKRGRPRVLPQPSSSTSAAPCSTASGSDAIEDAEQSFDNGDLDDGSNEAIGKRRVRPPKNLEEDYSVTSAKRRRPKKDNAAERQYRCGERSCGYRFRTETSLEYHGRCHTPAGPRPYCCPECGEQRDHWRSLAMHLWRSHTMDLDLHRCVQCEYRTFSAFKLENHARIHSEERDFTCAQCGKGFKQLSQLRNHHVVHLDRKNTPHKRWYSQQTCELCQRTFSDSKCLRKHHQAVHGKVKPYVCPHCGHSSARKAMLQLHLRQHTGEKPFSCQICDYRTGDHNSLRRHKMRHSGTKPYKCPHCPYACIQAISYKMHMKNKHPGLDGLYACSLCNFRSVSKENYTNHMSDHKRGFLAVPAQLSSPSTTNSTASTEIEGLQVHEATLQQLETLQLLPGNVNAAQLIYSCLSALQQEGGSTNPPVVTTYSTGDGTTITIQVPSSATEDDSGSSLLATPAEQDQFYLTLQQQEDGSMAYVSGEGFSSQGGDMDNEASGLKISAVHFTESR